jgi:hypothetical protein
MHIEIPKNITVDYKKYLSQLDTAHFLNNISAFRDLNFKRLSYKEVKSAIEELFYVIDEHNQQYCGLIQERTVYSKGTSFYRTRRIDDSDCKIPLTTITQERDLWCPSRDMIKMQRVNLENEQILYTTPKFPRIAIEETKVPDRGRFILLQYDAVEDISVILVGLRANVDGLNKDEQVKHNLINAFMRDEFTREVGTGTEYLYKISNCLAKEFYGFLPGFADAWCYPSVVDKKNCNVCLQEKIAKKKMIMKGFYICQKIDVANGFEIETDFVGRFIAGRFSYEKLSAGVVSEQLPLL